MNFRYIFAERIVLTNNNMANKGSLHTIKESHSVKEAVMSFTVIPQIQDPNSYGKLLEAGQPLDGTYHRFEPVKTVEVRMDINLINTQYKTIKDSGFKLIAFKDGKTTNIIQGLNQPNSGVFTFNTVNYSRWSDFAPSAISAAKKIAEHNPNYKVCSFGLLFIDEFYFDEVNNYVAEQLFNIKSKNLPQGLFDSAVMDYNLVMRRNKEDKLYQENVSIKIFDEGKKKTIRIIENITFQIQPFNFVNLLNSPVLRQHMDFIHKENKAILIDVLNPEVSNLIGLNI